MVAVETAIISPHSVHVIITKKWFHDAITSVMVRLGQVAVKAWIEVLEQLFHFSKTTGAVLLVMFCWKLMAPTTGSVEDPWRRRCELYVLLLH